MGAGKETYMWIQWRNSWAWGYSEWFYEEILIRQGETVAHVIHRWRETHDAQYAYSTTYRGVKVRRLKDLPPKEELEDRVRSMAGRVETAQKELQRLTALLGGFEDGG